MGDDRGVLDRGVYWGDRRSGGSWLGGALRVGGGLGHFKTGRSVKFATAQPHNNLLISIAQAMGSNITTFGDPAYGTGPLPGLT